MEDSHAWRNEVVRRIALARQMLLMCFVRAAAHLQLPHSAWRSILGVAYRVVQLSVLLHHARKVDGTANSRQIGINSKEHVHSFCHAENLF